MTHATETSAGDASYNNPYDDPLFLSNSDHANMTLTSTPFSGKNFLSWSREIKEGFLSCKSAKLLWTDICERYGQSNAPLLYQLKKELKNISQENSTVVEYFNKLKRHWDDVEELEEIPECSCGAMDKCTCNLYKKLLEIASREKVINFLMGLGDAYENLRTNILAMDPMPMINKAYSIVQQVESQKMITNVINSGQEASTMNATNSAGKQPWNKKGHTLETCFVKNPELRKKFLARFSGNTTSSPATVHSSSNPGVFPGYNSYSGYNKAAGPSAPPGYVSQAAPPGYGSQAPPCYVPNAPGPSGYAHNAVAPAKQDNPFHSSDVSVNFAGISLANHSHTALSSTEWIIDSGASDHMCGNPALFTTLHRLSVPLQVGLPDGSIQNVAYTEDIRLPNGIVLVKTLFVPAFRHNLLSVSKLLITTGLLIQFSVGHCIIQDPVSSCPMAVGIQEKGLYKLRHTAQRASGSQTMSVAHNKIDNKAVHNVLSSDCSSSNMSNCNSDPIHSTACNSHAVVELLHARLGHASLVKMQCIDPSECNKLKNYFKTQVASVFEGFLAQVENLYHSSVKVVKSDNGTEIVQEFCLGLMNTKGILHQKSIPGTPQ
ncbi:uncharacterized protein LOC141613021 [Silene latifolia]|uniref:uncharacterized protein LOC141613021 n=1 Tax=Silene latifolia TaxID=37657 RepID=UPI003D771DEA